MIAFAGLNSNYGIVRSILCISTDHVLVYMNSFFHRFVSFVGLGWVSFNGSLRRGQALLIYPAIFLYNILDRKITCPSQPPSRVRRKYHIYTWDLAWLVCLVFAWAICQSFGVSDLSLFVTPEIIPRIR